jgi:hypothetical protein
MLGNRCHICLGQIEELNFIKCKLCCDGLEQKACQSCCKAYWEYKSAIYQHSPNRDSLFRTLQILRQQGIDNIKKIA